METATEVEGTAKPRARKPMEQVVLREFPSIGKYKVRLVRGAKADSQVYLDIREYVIGTNYEGFTRKGVRLAMPADAETLRALLEEAMRL